MVFENCYNNKLNKMYTTNTFNKEVDIPEVEEDNIKDIIREQGIDIGSTHTEHNKENNYE